MRSYGYGEEFEHVPVEQEYLYQFSDTEWVNPYLVKWQIPTNTEWKNPYTYQNPDWKNPLNPTSNGTPKQRAKWQKEFDFHMLQATRTYNDAKNRCWYLPQLTWRERAKEAWMAAFSTVGSSTLNMRLVVAVSSLLMQYGIDCLNEWEYIEEKLRWCEYHLKECEKYSNLLNP